MLLNLDCNPLTMVLLCLGHVIAFSWTTKGFLVICLVWFGLVWLGGCWFGFVVGFPEELQMQSKSKTDDQHKERKGTCSQTPPARCAAAAVMLKGLFR